MARHVKTVHQVGLDLDSNLSNVFPCENCPSKFTNERDLAKHYHLYHAEKTIVICERCNRPYDAGPTLIRRFPEERKSCSCLQRGTEKEKDKKGEYFCECGKSFSYERYLRRHQRNLSRSTSHRMFCKIHRADRKPSPEKPHVNICKYCGKNYWTPRILDLHIRRIHKKEKNFACAECNKGFFILADLQKHHSTNGHNGVLNLPKTSYSNSDHSGNSDSECDINIGADENQALDRQELAICECGKSFAKKHYLARHRKEFCKLVKAAEGRLSNEDDVKKFSCNQCDKNFTTQRILFDHIRRVHEKQKNFACAQCKWQFYSSGDLKRHHEVHNHSGSLDISKKSDSEESENSNSESDKSDDEPEGIFEEPVRLEIGKEEPESIIKVKSYPCNLCEKSFFTHEQLEIHFQHHEIESIIQERRSMNVEIPKLAAKTLLSSKKDLILVGPRRPRGRPRKPPKIKIPKKRGRPRKNLNELNPEYRKAAKSQRAAEKIEENANNVEDDIKSEIKNETPEDHLLFL